MVEFFKEAVQAISTFLAGVQDTTLPIVKTVNSWLTDYVLIILLIGTGLYFTIRTGCVQLRFFGEGAKNVFGNIKLRGGKQAGGLSSFQALATAIAAQVGTGNIVGASGAILTGGPGAIFWMWIIAFLGMSTIYAEAVLAQKTRVTDENGEIQGGPVYYIKQAFKGKFGKVLAVFFAVSAILALGFMGSMVQSNSIAQSCQQAFGIPTWAVGLIVAGLCAIIFIGGINRIASVTEKIVPLMAVFFLLGGVVVLAFNFKVIPATFGMIFKYAFTPEALLGASFGVAIKTAISQGAKRGLFSNEAGMGSTPHAHAQANVKKPHDQGTVAMIGVFIDTFVVLTMTALVVISTLYTREDGVLHGLVGEAYKAATSGDAPVVGSATAMQTAVTAALPTWLGKTGDIFVAICLFFFAFSTIVSWNFFGKVNALYLFGKNKKVTTIVYSVISVGFIFLGALAKNSLVWELTDFFNYLMVLPNVIAILVLSTVVAKESKEAKLLKQAEKNKK